MASLQQQQQSSSSISNDDSLSPAQIGILGLNSMSYKLPNDLSVVVQRNVQSTYFTTQSASPGNTLIAIRYIVCIVSVVRCITINAT